MNIKPGDAHRASYNSTINTQGAKQTKKTQGRYSTEPKDIGLLERIKNTLLSIFGKNSEPTKLEPIKYQATIKSPSDQKSSFFKAIARFFGFKTESKSEQPPSQFKNIDELRTALNKLTYEVDEQKFLGHSDLKEEINQLQKEVNQAKLLFNATPQEMKQMNNILNDARIALGLIKKPDENQNKTHTINNQELKEARKNTGLEEGESSFDKPLNSASILEFCNALILKDDIEINSHSDKIILQLNECKQKIIELKKNPGHDLQEINAAAVAWDHASARYRQALRGF